jgi:hypothetical protein
MTTMRLGQYAERMGVRAPYLSRLKREGRLVLTAEGAIEVEATDRALADSIDWPLEISRGPGKVARALQRLGLGPMPQTMNTVSERIGPPRCEPARDVDRTYGEVPDRSIAGEAGAGLGAHASQDPAVGGGGAWLPADVTSASRSEAERQSQFQERELGDVGELTQARISREQAEAQMAQLKLLEKLGVVTPTADIERELTGVFRGIKEGLLALADRLSPLLAAEYDEGKVRVMLNAEVRKLLNELADRAGAVVDASAAGAHGERAEAAM